MSGLKVDLLVTTFIVIDGVVTLLAPVKQPQRKMTRMERYYFRKENQLCTGCGKKLYVNNAASTCYRCKKASSRRTKRWRKRNPSKVAKQQAWLARDRKANPTKYRRMRRKKYRDNQAKKVCVDCSQQAAPGHIECERHLELGRKRSLSYYNKSGRERRRELKKATK